MFSSKNTFLAAPSGYQISRSVRLRSSASAYLTRTPASAGSQTTWTYSTWIKRGALNTRQFITMSGVNPNASQVWQVEFDANNKLSFYNQTIGIFRLSTQVFRDPSSWYHIVFTADTTNATAQSRFRCWVNGEEITAWDTNSTIASSYAFAYNGAYLHGIGAYSYSPSLYFDGYITETHFVDGQALTPSSFGEIDPVTGVWEPKKYAGTYGTNGFYLNFSDNSAATATAIGKDYSGNNNNWTPNNISVTAGATYDSMIDVPTIWGDRGNYCTLNPLKINGVVGTFSNANLTGSLSTDGSVFGSIAVSTGKWYWEITPTISTGAATTNNNIGVSKIEATTAYAGNTADGFCYRIDGNKYSNSTASAYGSSWALNDVIGVALDLDSGTVTFYKNGVSQGIAFTGLSGTFAPVVANGNTSTTKTWNANFGQRPFTYTPPTDFKALNTQNLPDATIKKGNQYFDILTWSGDSTNNRSITGLNFSPDFAWVKSRSYAGQSHHFVDNVRGVGTGIMRTLYSNQTVAEETTTSAATLTFGGIKSLDANGITTVAGTNGANPYAQTNQSPQTYVGWHWNAGGSTVTNTSGTISSQVRANPSAGFSIVTYTGTGANATVGHGLGVAPKMIIVKTRSAVDGWGVYHSSLTNTQALLLESTAAVATSATYWNSTSPTSSVFSVGTWSRSNASAATYVAYCFSEVAGYSKFGSYTGNGSADGSFVYLGFRPRWVMFKRTDTTSNWLIIDSVRGSYNADKNRLFPNLSNAEDTSENFDFLSNGFKLRDSAGSMNASGGTYIYAAFAENPFKHSLAR